MSSVDEIRTAIAARLAGIAGLYVHAKWPGTVNGDAAVVRRLNTDFGEDFNGSDRHRFGVTLYLPFTDTASAQDRLDDYCSTAGTQSVKAALEDDPTGTLGGVVQFFNVDGVDEEGIVELGGVTYISATVTLTVGSL